MNRKLKKSERLQIVEIKNPHIECNLHGIQKLKQSTKYGSALCEQCLKDIKEFNENIKVIIESAYVVSEYRNKAFEMGADDFVSKPFNKSQIYNAILKQI